MAVGSFQQNIAVGGMGITIVLLCEGTPHSMEMYLKRSLAVVASAALLLPVVGPSSVFAARTSQHVHAGASLIWFMRTDPN